MRKVGVIGCGMIWKMKHSKAILEDLPDRLKIAAVYDVSRDAAEEAAKATGARAAGGWREIVDDPEIDIVVSCTPPYVRAEHAVAAAQNGKSLLLEKPLARSAEDARAIEKAIADNGVSCVEAFFRAVNALPQHLTRDTRPGGPFGSPVQFFLHVYGPPYGWLPDLNHWMFNKELSGGPLMDFSCHFIELALALFDSPVASVWSEGGRITHPLPGDDTGILSVRFADGGSAYVTQSWTAPRKAKTLFRWGLVTSKGIFESVEQALVGQIDGEEIRIEPEARYAGAYESLLAAMEGKPQTAPSAREGRRVTELLCKAFESQESGMRLDVNI